VGKFPTRQFSARNVPSPKSAVVQRTKADHSHAHDPPEKVYHQLTFERIVTDPAISGSSQSFTKSEKQGMVTHFRNIEAWAQIF
jgi:hypothetical protein